MNDYYLDFHASREANKQPLVRVSIRRGAGIIGVDPQNGLTPVQQHKLNDIVKRANRRGMYGSIMDTLVERGIDGECGFEPNNKRIYFVGEGDSPVEEFLSE